MSSAPGCSDPEGLPNVSFLGDDTGDGYDVVGISSVLESEKEAESENRQYAGSDVHDVLFGVCMQKNLNRSEQGSFSESPMRS